MGRPGGKFELWSEPHRRVLVVLLSALLAWLSIRYWLNPVYVSDPQPQRGARYEELADRIDPNTAEWPALASLPGVGENRAREIVAYRERFTADHPGKPAFARPQDLLRIRGIGVATMEALEPYLLWPGEATPVTAPTRRP